MDEMRLLAFSLNINHEAIQGATADEWSRELVRYCERRGISDLLIAVCQEQRPTAPWPVL